MNPKILLQQQIKETIEEYFFLSWFNPMKKVKLFLKTLSLKKELKRIKKQND